MATEREMVAAFWRLAEQAERYGIRIMVEPLSGEHFATSGSDPRKLYRLTHWSCTCPGFARHQRCQHYALFLSELGWLPDPDPEPAPPVPRLGSGELPPDPCPTCRSLGSTMRQGSSGAWFEVPCPDCGGTGRTVARGVASTDAVPGPSSGTENAIAAGDVTTADNSVTASAPPSASASPDPWAVEAAPVEAPVPTPESGEAMPAPIHFTRREDRARELTATVDEAIASLARQLAAGHTEDYLAVLGFFSRFHRYSLANTILIRRQRPDASLVAGLKRWNQLGYKVRAAERAVWIWAPLIKKDVDAVTGEESERVVGFRPAPVFADSQLANLDDKPLPSLFRPLPDDCEDLYQTAKRRVIATGIAVEEIPLPGGIQGASTGGRILIRAGLASRSRLLTLLHECAHELVHHGEGSAEKPLALRELEAESTAYVVGQVLGVANPFSADYLLNYGLDAAALQASLTSIQTVVRMILRIIRPADEQEVPLAA
jgi:hypothetical protein